MTNLETEQGLLNYIKELLKKRFPSDRFKQEVYESGDKYNFACPYCGDSKVDSRKKRGNLYPARGYYRCYNDGCGAKSNIQDFISKFTLKYSIDLPSVNFQKSEWKPSTSIKRRGSLIELIINSGANQHLLKLEDIVARFSLIPCEKLDRESWIAQYIEKRSLFDLPLFLKSAYCDWKEDKIYLFNLDQKSGKILGFAIRRLGDFSGPKYLIKFYSELKKNGLVSQLQDDVITNIDTLNNYFNVLNIDFSQPVIITEGQLDSMFLTNSIAITGITKSSLLLDNLLNKSTTLILYDSDSAGKTESIKMIKAGYRVFLWNKLFKDLKKKYPTSSLAIREIKDVNDLYNFIKSREGQPNLTAFNQYLLTYFSTSEFDLFWI
jgi:hypothetical protein